MIHLIKRNHKIINNKINNKNNNKNIFALFSLLVFFILAAWLSISTAPILALIYQSWHSNFAHWPQLWQSVLPDALINSLYLLLGSVLLAAIFGFLSAWLLARYHIFGRRFFNWALILPLAMPTYIMAFAYLDLWHPLGPLQSGLRFILGYENPRQFRLPDVRGLPALIILMALTLYPYVFLAVRTALLKASADLEHSSQLLGLNIWQRFYHVELPLIKPALWAGGVLVVLDALNDIGASEFLGVKTLTVLIYNMWISQGNLAAAAQLALSLLLLLFIITSIGQLFHTHQMVRVRPISLKRLPPLLHFFAYLFLITLWGLAFLAPFLYLLQQSFLFIEINWQQSESLFLLQIIKNSFGMAAVASLLIVLLSVFLIMIAHKYLKQKKYILKKKIFLQKKYLQKISLYSMFLAILNAPYALPASILGIGFLIAAQGIHYYFQGWQASSVYGLMLIYMIRFGRVAYTQIDQGLRQIATSIKDSAYLLGLNEWRNFYYIQWPLLWPYVCASFLLIFVEMMKELSLTLLIRPIGFETLALWLYDQVSRGQYEQASIFALMIVFLGLLPIYFIIRAQQKTSPH